MNIKHYLSAVVALSMLAACSDYDPGTSGEAVDLTDAEVATLEEYKANFIARYGTPAENHTWGFGAKGSENEMGTRSTDVPESNLWVSLNKDSQRNLTSITYDYVDGMVPPGFPDNEGNYHIWTDWGASHNYANEEVLTYDQLADRVKNNNVDFVSPSGDVTDEEILYVSAWFRNNQNPTPDPLNADKFYVQAISKDYDRTSYAATKGLNNQGTSNWSEGEVGGYKKAIPLNWYKNAELSTSGPNGEANTTREENYSLDQLGVKAPNDNEYVHIYNENAGATSSISETNPTGINTETWSALGLGISSDISYRVMMCMTNTGTTDFRAWNSGDSNWEFQWVLKHLTFTGRDGKSYDGWYLAFDTRYRRKLAESDVWNATTQSNDHYEQWEDGDYDGYYSNYIVKIVPGNGNTQPQHTWHRIMCEDLGSTDDYDFNDLVYDVYFTNDDAGHYTAHIKVQASGGILPIYVATYTEDETREAHQILQSGNAHMSGGYFVPVNVAIGVTTDPSNEFTFEMKDKNGNWYDATKGTDPDYIPILVTSKDKSRQEAAKKNTFVLPQSGKSVVPQKICIDGNLIDATKVRWMEERQQIESCYERFDNWVIDGVESEYHFGKSQDWTKDPVNTGHLY